MSIPTRSELLQEAEQRIQAIRAEQTALAAIGSSFELQFSPPTDCPVHRRLTAIKGSARLEYIQHNFDSLSDEARAHPKPTKAPAKSGPAPGTANPRNWQTPAPTPAFGPSPSQYLEHFESITNPIEKDWFFQQHKLEIEVGLQARLWQEQEDAAAAVRAAAMPDPNSLSAQLEAISNPTARRQFFEKNKDAIRAEAQERSYAVQHVVNPRNLVTEPAAQNL